jgi:hypothetical protein
VRRRGGFIRGVSRCDLALKLLYIDRVPDLEARKFFVLRLLFSDCFLSLPYFLRLRLRHKLGPQFFAGTPESKELFFPRKPVRLYFRNGAPPPRQFAFRFLGSGRQDRTKMRLQDHLEAAQEKQFSTTMH